MSNIIYNLQRLDNKFWTTIYTGNVKLIALDMFKKTVKDEPQHAFRLREVITTELKEYRPC